MEHVTTVDELIAQLTLEEKALLCVGRDFWTTQPVDRLGIPSIWLADGPTGVRKAQHPNEPGIGTSLPATCFPTASALAASWDTELVREVGQAIAVEAQAQGVQILLGPGVNLKRSPLGGRNFEYFSEDPVLSGELAAAFIAGAQSQGVGACLKHFVGNENETGRMYADSIVDERTLREVYLRPFEIAITKSNPWAIMAAYNRVNGAFCTENAWLLRDIVHDEWGHDGIIISDWLAVNDRVTPVVAGLHLQMPGGPLAERIVEAVRTGQLPEAKLDTVVRELLTVILRADAARNPRCTFDPAAHHLLARRIAAECITLLKNDGNLLPLDQAPLSEIALIGAFAKTPRYQGAGSSEVVPTRVDNAHDEIVALLGSSTRVTYAAGYDDSGAPNPALLQEACAVASQAQVAIVFAGLPPSFESEGIDRKHLDLPSAHNALVNAVVEAQPRTVVVLINGSAVTMPWASRVPAIVEAWLGGQGAGGAIADVLLGKVNPSGKLAETFPARLEDTPSFLSFPGDPDGRVVFTEGVFTGYRWYDARAIEPLFPFGHGLSYTTFAYSDLEVSAPVVREHDVLDVAVTIQNTGQRFGKEVVQLYLHERAPVYPRPPKELKAFQKVALAPGEEQRIRFHLTARDFAQYDPHAQAWLASSGTFDIMIGASSRDIRLSQSVEFVAMAPRPLRLDRYSPIRAWLAHPAGRALLAEPLAALQHAIGATAEAGTTPMLDAFFLDLPIGKLVLLGAITEPDLQRMLATVQASPDPQSA